MKKLLIIFTLAALLVAAARSVRFTVVNKSNRELVVHLTSLKYPQHLPYIFTVAAGTKEYPVESGYDVKPGDYYVDVYTPGGVWCIPETLPENYKRVPISIKHNMKFVLLPCFTITKTKSGAASIKWYQPKYYYQKTKR